MERREDELTGHGGLHSDGGTLDVTDLTDHDHVRILTEDGAEPRRIGVIRFIIDFTLYDSGELILDRILESDNLFLGSIECLEHRIEGRRLSAPGWSGHEDHTAFFPETSIDLAFRCPLETELCYLRD